MSSSPLVVMMIMLSIVVVFQADVALGIKLPPPPRQPVTYRVGGVKGWGWSTATDLSNWLNGKTFRVGDKLQFWYNVNQHDVYQVKEGGYNSCKTGAGDLPFTTGKDEITLSNKGTYFFICNFPNTCANGMKLKVTVN